MNFPRFTYTLIDDLKFECEFITGDFKTHEFSCHLAEVVRLIHENIDPGHYLDGEHPVKWSYADGYRVHVVMAGVAKSYPLASYVMDNAMRLQRKLIPVLIREMEREEMEKINEAA